ncbi:MAG: VWA domain-containing protein [Gemmataceae bacterium]|nr:VWA domain-containing protein [Gemmataceae bacterium]
MQEVLQFAIAGRLREQAAVVGDPLEEFLPTGGAGLEVALQTPDGRNESLRTEARHENSVLRWTDTDISGLYRALIGQHPQEFLFAVNVPTSTESQQACESDLARTNAAELQGAYPGWEFQLVTELRDVVHSGGVASEAVAGDHPIRGMGMVLARWLLGAVLVLLLAEVVLAWRFGHYSAVGASDVTPAPGRLLPMSAGVLAGATFVLLAGVLAHAAWTGDFLSFLPEGVRSGIETRLGIPPPAAGEGARWHLEFTPYLGDALTNRWLASTLALAAAALVIGIYWHEGYTAGLAYKLLLAGFRIFLVFLMLTVLLPQVRLWFERQGWPDLVILIDDSRSMSATDRYQDAEVSEAVSRLAQEAGLTAPQRLQLAQVLLTRRKPDWLEDLITRRKVKVHVYHGSTRAARLSAVAELDQHDAALQALQGLSAEGESSQLGTALRQVLNDFRGSSLAAVIMLTDGVTTEGEDLVKVSRYAGQMGVPLFYVGIGDSHPVRDIKLHDLQVEDAVYVNDRVVFEAFVTGQGYGDRTVPVELRAKGKDLVLARQMVPLDREGKPIKFRVMYQPAEPGERTYVLEVPEQEGEKQLDNNRLERPIFVREAKVIKVLYVEGSARYDYRFIKHLLERESDRDKRNKTLDVRVLLLDADPEYPSEDRSALADFPTKEELNAYDVVLFGDVDPQDKRIEKNLQHVADFVRERGGGFLMIAGEQYSPHAYKDSPLRDMLPIEVLGPQPEADYPTGFRPEQTAAGRFHSIFRFSPDEVENMAVWNQLAEIHWWSEGYRAKPTAEALLVHPERPALDPRRTGGAAKDRHPLIVQQFVGSGRSMFFGFNESWRWRLREHELRFNQFWIQTVRYLARSRSGRVKLYLDKQTPYRRGEPIKVTVRFPDDAPPPPPEMKVEVVKERTPMQAPAGAEIDRETVPLLKVEGSRATYEGSLTRTPEGEYRFWLKAPVVTGPKPRAECKVLPPPGEMDLLRMNQPDMERSAEETHGRFYTLAEADRVLDELPSGTRVALNTPQPPTLLWNHFLVFALVLTLLGTEWALRKRKHLL